MCGISGIILSQPKAIPKAWIDRFQTRLRHRGPDDEGCLIYGERILRTRERPDGEVGQVLLMQRRLSIIDLSDGGWQPMSSSDGRYHIVFNGEIYNYKEVRKDLEALGRRFGTSSDTEVLLEAFAAEGVECLRRFRGMFAFAVLDTIRRTVTLARDPFGIKPLYYTRMRGGLAFASEPVPLLDLPGISRRVAPDNLFYYLRFGLTEHNDGTMFADIHALPAAHCMVVELNHPTRSVPVRYWSPVHGGSRSISFDDAAEHLRSLFLDSVRLHLRSDVPVGIALSGGLDSTSILMAARAALPDAEIPVFSFIASGHAINEEHRIDDAVKAAHATSYKVSLSPEELLRDLPDLVSAQGEPFGSTNIWASYRVYKMAHDHGIKVILDGQGGDEVLGGYTPAIGARLGSLLRQASWIEAAAYLRTLASNGTADQSPVSALMNASDCLLPPKWQELPRYLIGRPVNPRWMNASWFRERGVHGVSLKNVKGPEVLKGQMRNNIESVTLPHLLRYTDRNSMHWSVESRLPFLLPDLYDFSLTLPEEYLVDRTGMLKAVMRHAMRDLLPDSVRNCRIKIGFDTPADTWLRAITPRIIEHVTTGRALLEPIVNVDLITRDLEDLATGKASFGTRFWLWFNLIVWAESTGAVFE